MQLVQKIRGDQTTTGEIARSVYHMALRVDVVFDTSRAWNDRLVVMVQLMGQWRSFLSLIHNKYSLIMFSQNCSGFFRCFLANSNLIFLILRLTSGLHLMVNHLYFLW